MRKSKLQWDVVFAWGAVTIFIGIFWWEVIHSIIHIIQKHT
jgi:hypothetical protein